jgi:hypothetical protein
MSDAKPTETTPTRYNVRVPYVSKYSRDFNVFAESREDAIRYAMELFRMDQKDNCTPQGDPEVKILNPGTVCHES